MRQFFILMLGFFGVFANAFAYQCKSQQELISLDNIYENSIRNADTQLLDHLLTDNFIWVHNLNSMQETKAGLIKRISATEYEKPLKRESKIEQFISQDKSWVVMGIAHIYKSRPEQDNPDNIRHYQYYFSRTYQQQKDGCKLLAVMTMKIATKDNAQLN
ncbi:nuclear transport factor 2 family protein [Catenovulum sp. 2E275]|uniref:nuclear transport factor 2 family protein n=1 Tax=Catenovulum sp. 2E275 TaxID=2980497 RepID=UPI0021CE181B|nr:nuclear transport factor 2 family protein [Catenovulum sp. 2E275]MCU4677315.1 nuclear transport factor 2 family protein [Catenovulum sp. 2E275]